MNTRKFVPVAAIAIASLALAGVATRLAARQTARQGQQQKPGSDSGQNQSMPGMDDSMPGMDMDHDMPGMKMGHQSGEKDQQAEHGAMDAMSHMHHHQMGPHMYMTKLRPAAPQDWAKADEIVGELRESIEKYKDYHAALADGFRAFSCRMFRSPNITSRIITTASSSRSRSIPHGLLPCSTSRRLWATTLIGAMYTMPKRVSEDQLNERIPLSVAQWHLHTNLLPASKGRAAAMPIAPSLACKAPSLPRKPALKPVARSIP